MFVVRIPKSLCNQPKFAKFILAKLINDTSASLSRSSYIRLDDYIRKFLEISEYDYENRVTCYSLISYYIRTFHVTDRGDEFLVGDAEANEIVVGSIRRFYDVVRLMEYGAKGIPSVPRIVPVINKIQNNLEDLYESYVKITKKRKDLD